MTGKITYMHILHTFDFPSLCVAIRLLIRLAAHSRGTGLPDGIPDLVLIMDPRDIVDGAGE